MVLIVNFQNIFKLTLIRSMPSLKHPHFGIHIGCPMCMNFVPCPLCSCLTSACAQCPMHYCGIYVICMPVVRWITDLIIIIIIQLVAHELHKEYS